MLFNSIDFAIFLPVVFVLYWFFVNKDLKQQNAFLLISSYFFYGWWDWRFLSLIVFSSFVDYFVGRRLRITSDERKRRWLLLSSILVNLGFLGFFKYFNFFAESFSDAFTLFGKSFAPYRLNIILPVGISFYTFQTMSYTIDVYRRRLDPTDDIIAFFAFVSFFPQLVAGPIERASNLLPQFYRHRVFEYDRAIDGMRQILWGLFKKIVIADNCALYVNQIFSDYAHLPGSTLLLGAFFFAFQILHIVCCGLFGRSFPFLFLEVALLKAALESFLLVQVFFQDDKSLLIFGSLAFALGLLLLQESLHLFLLAKL